MKARLPLVLAAFVPLALSPLRAETTEQWIAKARAYLGSESDLNAITSIHFSGRLEGTEKVPAPDDKTRLIDQKISVPIELIFQKPYRQLMTLTRADSIATTALDDYDGWSKTSNPKDPKQWRLTLLDAQQIKRFRANTWEALYFYAGIEKRGGRVQLGGDVTVDGVACVKLLFIHADRIVFLRYFDKITGKLIKTETESGAEIREEGVQIVNGIRFPKKNINKAPNGQITTIVFDKVVLNEHIPASEFAVPALQPN
jgi:hypothetical protein